MSKELLKLRGIFRLKVFQNDELIEDTTKNNLIVLTGRSQLAQLLGGVTTNKFVDAVEMGTNATAPASSDNAITAPYSVPTTSSFPNAGEVQFDWVLPVGQNNGVTISEFGLVCNDSVLFSRVTRAPIVKNNTIRLEGEWTIAFQ